MLRMQGVGEYFSALARGDTVALIVTAVFVTFVLLVVMVAIRFHYQMKREDKEHRERFLKKKKK